MQKVKKRKRGRPTSQQEIDLSHVLEVAVNVFADNGFAGTQMKEIAQKAGMANSMLTYHFENKETLWKRSVAQLGKKLQERFVEVDSYLVDVEGLTALKAYTRQFIYFSAEFPEFYKIVFHEMCTKTARADWIIETVLSPLHQFFKKSSDDSKGQKMTMGGIPIANILSIVVGSANVFFIHAYHLKKMYGTNPFEKEEIVKHADIVLELLFQNFEGKVDSKNE